MRNQRLSFCWKVDEQPVFKTINGMIVIIVQPIHVYDDRFVAENVFIGHHISVDQRRNLYGLVIGDQAIALKQAVDTAEQQLSNATTAFNTAQSASPGLYPLVTP